jgi:hypothetical protein
LNKLCYGDSFNSIQAIENKLTDEKKSIQALQNVLSDSIYKTQEVLNKLCYGDSFTSIQTIENKLTDEKLKIQSLLNTLSAPIEKIQTLLQTLSTGDVTSIQKALIEIAEKDFVIGRQKVLQSLQGISTMHPAVGYDIVLDGISIKNKITEVIISNDENNIHNSITIQSIQSNLFWDCNPSDSAGTSRIKVQVGTRQMYFLLEKRSGDEQSFSVWGRSLSAREDSSYAEDVAYSLTEPKSAKSVVEEILTVSSLSWECDDWVLPALFEFEGSPIEGVSQIADVIGAVVRCEDNGTICVRQRFPVRPVDMSSAGVAINYNRTNLISLDYGNIQGTYYNAIEVMGYTDDVHLPDMQLEESSPEIGDDVHVRVYWAGKKPSGIIEVYITDGSIILLGEATTETEEAETVTFEDGIASVSKPITSVVSTEWIGDLGGSISYEKYSKNIEIANEAYRIAKVIYTTTYSRYYISKHYVEELLALLTFGGESDVSVIVKMGLGDKFAPALNNPLLTSRHIAVIAGTAWLDTNKYDQKQITLEAPYNDLAIDGALTYINDAEIDCVGNFHIKKSNIVIRGPKIINELGLIQCQA